MSDTEKLFYSKIKTEIGLLHVVTNGKALKILSFDSNWIKTKKKIKTPLIEISSPLHLKIENQIQEYMAGERKFFNIPIDLVGTDFQKNVWNALLKIPYGKTLSYGAQAESIGNKKAVRAVGLANGRNPVAIIVPCHRVIGKNGSLTGYAGGLSLKEKLLQIEQG